MITKRDKQMLFYLQDYKCAHTSTLKMFYPDLRTCQRRLKILCDSKVIGRVRNNITAEYIYYFNKPKQLKHSVLLTDFLREFSRLVKIENCKTEVAIGNLRADALIGYKYQNKLYLAFLEIQISNNPLDVQKYEKLYYSGLWKEKLPVFPSVIVVTDRRIPNSALSIKRVNENLTSIMDIFQEK